MDVVNTRAHLCFELGVVQGVEQLEVGTAGFERDHVGVHVVDIADNVAKFAIAHVRVDLRFGLDLGVNQAECRNGPVEVFLVPIALAERQLFAESGFVNLDDSDAVLFEVQNFVADGEANLLSLRLERNIFTRERPVENRYRTRKHALHRLLGAALCENGPFNRNRSAAAHVAPNDRRLHATGTVALHPSILREHKAVNLGTEIFHHVITFKFTMHNHIEANFFLQLDAFCNLLLVESDILFLGNFTLAECGAVGANFGRLREGTDRCCRERRQLEFILLHGAACEAARLALEISGGECGKLTLDSAIFVDACACEQSLVLCKCICVSASEFCKFRELFFGECKVLENIGRKLLFCSDRVRHMQKRARSANDRIFGSHILFNFSEECILMCVIGAPDVLTVHNTREKNRTLREALLQKFERLETFNKVKADAVKAECNNIFVNIADVAEVSLQIDLQLGDFVNLLDKFNINGLEECAFFGSDIENQSRFCDADPLGACSGELVGEYCVSGDCGSNKVLSLLLTIVTGEAEERIRANHGRNGFDSGSLCFVELINRLLADELEFGSVVNFWNNVMIVRIEPLLHREGLHVALCTLVTVGGGEILFERAQFEAAVAFRNDVQQKCGVENVVVE